MIGFKLVRSVAACKVKQGVTQGEVDAVLDSYASLLDEVPELISFSSGSSTTSEGRLRAGWIAVASSDDLLQLALSHPMFGKLRQALTPLCEDTIDLTIQSDGESETWQPRVKDEWVELDDMVAPQHTILVVVDVQNDYCSPGGARFPSGFDFDPVKESIIETVEAARRAGIPVVYTVALTDRAHDHGPVLSRRRRVGLRQTSYTIEGEWGAQVCDWVAPQAEDPVVRKWRHSAFTNPSMDSVLRRLKAKSLVFVGVATNGCVEGTVRDAFGRGYYTTVVQDAVGAYDPELQRYSLKNIATHFGVVVESKALQAVWDGSRLGRIRTPA